MWNEHHCWRSGGLLVKGKRRAVALWWWWPFATLPNKLLKWWLYNISFKGTGKLSTFPRTKIKRPESDKPSVSSRGLTKRRVVLRCLWTTPPPHPRPKLLKTLPFYSIHWIIFELHERPTHTPSHFFGFLVVLRLFTSDLNVMICVHNWF